METSVKKIKNLPLRKYLVFSVLITLAIIVLLSVATIFDAAPLVVLHG